MSNTEPSSIPPWSHFMRPLLVVLADGAVWAKRDLEEAILDAVDATEDQRTQVLASGQFRIRNRIGWATSFLVRSKAIRKPARARFVITDAGRALIAAHPDGISEAALRAIPAFNDYIPVRGRAVDTATVDPESDEEIEDPIEQIEVGIARFEADVASELLRRLREQTPAFFEQAVVELLIAMGYGSADDKRVRRIGGSGDGGVDGVIDQDALGLSRVYVQAKRYAATNAVQRPELQGFVGALADKGASQGVFVTTSTFSAGARQYVDRIPNRIVLIDGSRLAELMIQYRVAVRARETFVVVEVDENFFE